MTTKPDNQPLVCAHCRKQMAAYFEITHHQLGRTTSVQICSLVCIMQWAYTQGTMRTVQAAVGARDVLRGIAQMLKGPGK